jgi:hypothetical protein
MKILNKIVVLLFLFLVGCASEGKNEKKFYIYEQVTFDERIKRLSIKLVDLTAPSDLFIFPEFIEVFKEPQEYKKEALVLLSKSTRALIQKEIVIYSMMIIGYHDYLEVVETLFESFENEKEEANLLYVAIYSPFGVEHPIVSYYDEHEVIEILTRISRNERLPDYTKEAIDSILEAQCMKVVCRHKKLS